MDNDYIRFCMKCNWNDPDQGCTSDYSERVYQCPMYMHYHPEEVKEWEKDCIAWMSTKYNRRKKDGTR